MALAGYCKDCGQYVWLNDQWGCVNGHAWTEISNWYDTQTGVAVTPYWLQMPAAVAPQASVEPAPLVTPAVAVEVAPVATPAPAVTPPSSRLDLLTDLLGVLAQYPNYVSNYGTDTDIVINNEIAAAAWETGRKKVEYSAIMKAVESELTVYFWELITESSSGLSFGSLEAEATTTMGTRRWGSKSETILGPDGVAMAAEWDYAATRSIVESVVARHGWKLKSVLQKSSAQW